MGKAAYILQGRHIRDESLDLSQYDVVICNVNLNPRTVRKRLKDDCLMFGALNLCWLLEYGDAPIYSAIRNRFEPRDFFPDPVQGHKHFKIDFDVADKLVAAVWSTMFGWDGVYWDHGQEKIRPWRRPPEMSINKPQWEIRFKAWRQYVFQQIRRSMGPDFLQIINADGWSPDVDGLLLEDDGGFKQLGNSRARAIGAFASQRHSAGERTDRMLNIALEWGRELNLDGIAHHGTILPGVGDNIQK